MKSYLLTTLRSQLATLGAPAFLDQHPHAWVVWEAGDWKPPAKQTIALARLDVAKPQPATPTTAKSDESSLAIALSASGVALTLGRANDCDITINDGTLSSHHLTFRPQPGERWSVEDAYSKNGTVVDGVRLGAGRQVTLRDGQRIEAAKVNLTVHSPEGLIARLRLV